MYVSENVLPFFLIVHNGYLTIRATLREEWFVDSDDAWINRSVERLEVTTVISNGADYCEETNLVLTVTTTTRMLPDGKTTDVLVDAITSQTISIGEAEIDLYPEVVIIAAFTEVERGNVLPPPAYIWPQVVDDDTEAEVVEAEVLEVDFRAIGRADQVSAEDEPTDEYQIDWSRVPRI